MHAARTVRSAEELRGVSNHLHYEIGMLISSARGLASGVFGEKNAVHNAMVETFVLHLRVVVDFLYPRGRGFKDDDVLPWDFFKSAEHWCKIRDGHITKESKKVLEEARDRADKEMVHLTYSRLKVTPVAKKWPYIEIGNEALKAIQVFSNNVPKEWLGSDWFEGPKRKEGCQDS